MPPLPGVIPAPASPLSLTRCKPQLLPEHRQIHDAGVSLWVDAFPFRRDSVPIAREGKSLESSVLTDAPTSLKQSLL